MDMIDGHRDQRFGKDQERYGIEREKADRQVTDSLDLLTG
jgi:uncharacterized protein YjbJ (UPF0337 family)